MRLLDTDDEQSAKSDRRESWIARKQGVASLRLFCDGGSIPLEAQRWTCAPVASCLDPATLMLTKALASDQPEI